MRRHFVQNVATDNVCAFCAFRMQLRAPYPALNSQRRYLHNSGAWKKPQEVTHNVQRNFGDEEPRWYKQGSRRNTQLHRRPWVGRGPGDTSGRNRARGLSRPVGINEQQVRQAHTISPTILTRNRAPYSHIDQPSADTASSGLDAEPWEVGSQRRGEASTDALREIGQSRASNPGSADMQARESALLQRKLDHSNGTYRPDWACKVCASRNMTQKDRCRKCGSERPEMMAWRCRGCGTINTADTIHCLACKPEGNREDIFDGVPNWPHVTKIRPSVDPLTFTEDDSQGKLDDAQGFQEEESPEVDNTQRLQNAQDGTFVPISAHVKPRKTPILFTASHPASGPTEPSDPLREPKSRVESIEIPENTLESSQAISLPGPTKSELSFDPSFINDAFEDRLSTVNKGWRRKKRYALASGHNKQFARRKSTFSAFAAERPTRQGSDQLNESVPPDVRSKRMYQQSRPLIRFDNKPLKGRNPLSTPRPERRQPETYREPRFTFPLHAGSSREKQSIIKKPTPSENQSPSTEQEPPDDLASRSELGADAAFLDGDIAFVDKPGDIAVDRRSKQSKSKTERIQSKPRHQRREILDPDTLSERGDEKLTHKPREAKKFRKRDARSPTERPQRPNYDDVEEVVEEEDYLTAAREARKRKQLQRARKLQSSTPTRISLPEFISATNLAGLLRIRVEDFLKKMKGLGFDDLNHDHILDAETASLIAAEFNFEAVVAQEEQMDLKPQPPAEDPSLLSPRPPVITIMGHVDHGKTTLLDYLRKSSVAASEHGGITQHIGAFSVRLPSSSNDRTITFLDTPGHEAFLAMRQRGATVTDIVILVVAADDSVKPQTIEAIKHAQGANVPIIVAINKVDKGDADVERVKQDLARHSVEIEDYGGDTQVVCVSGKTGQGMQELEDAVVALADIIDMRAETTGCLAEGWVLESTTTKAGRVATVLVRRGTLHIGDVIVAGTSWAKVRGLRNEAGAAIPSAPPGTPVEIDGWRVEPVAGDEMLQASDEQRAKEVVDYRVSQLERAKSKADIAAVNTSRVLHQEKRDVLLAEKEAARLERATSKFRPFNTADTYTAAALTADPSISTTPAASKDEKAPEQALTGPKPLNLILKADVSGSLEALSQSLAPLIYPQVRTSIIRSSVGPVNESDIQTAALAHATIVAFNVDIDGGMRRQAEALGVKLVEQRIIYRVVEGVKTVMEGMLEGTVKRRGVGDGEVGEVFEIGKGRKNREKVAGVRVKNGVLKRGARVKVVRSWVLDVYDGTITSLKNVKKDVTEMRKGTECGVGFDGWQGFEVGDQLQCYEEVVEKPTLESSAK